MAIHHTDKSQQPFDQFIILKKPNEYNEREPRNYRPKWNLTSATELHTNKQTNVGMNTLCYILLKWGFAY